MSGGASSTRSTSTRRTFRRFGALGVIASMEGVHCTSDAPYVLARLGSKRAEEGAYVWQKLMKSGAVVTNGTDAPVEDVDPIASYYATVSRKLKDGSVFFPDQRMSRMEALRSYTINGAFAAFEDGFKGIAEGREVRRHRRALEGHPDRFRRTRFRPRRWCIRSWAGRCGTRSRLSAFGSRL